MLIVKANIRKPSNFVIENMAIDFGVCLVNETRSTQEIVISNTSQKQTRTFEVRVDFQSLKFTRFIPEINFDVVDDAEEEYFEEIPQASKDEASSSPDIGVILQKKRRKRPLMMLSKEVEEEIEHMQQKVKIAERKGRKDKAKKLLEKIEKLRSGVSTEDYGAEKEEEGVSETIYQNTGGTILNKEDSASPSAGMYSGAEGGSLNSSSNNSDAAGASNLAESEEGSASGQPETLIANSSGGGDGGSSIHADSSSSPVLRGVLLKTASLTPSAAISIGGGTTVKYRKTDNAIIFTLEPRQIRTVVVTFRALEIRPNLDGLPPDAPGNPLLSLALESLCNNVEDSSSSSMMEICSGQILVHELKNTDVVKQVSVPLQNVANQLFSLHIEDLNLLLGFVPRICMLGSPDISKCFGLHPFRLRRYTKKDIRHQ